MLSENRKDILVSLCREMIRIPSPSGGEARVAELIEKTMKKSGFDEVAVDRYGNVVGRIVLGRGGRKILLEGHMDHVDVSDPSRWTRDPFGGDLVDGKIYGRGATDMKGNLAAMIKAASFIKEDLAGELDGEILVGGCVHEECFEGVASEEIDKNFKPDFVVIGEPSGLTLKRGQRGRAEVLLETFGKNAHSSNPSVGVNAVKKMMKAILAIESGFTPKRHPVLGDGILEVTDIISSPFPGASVVPDRCSATFDRRLLENETKEDVLGQIREFLAPLISGDPQMKVSVSLARGEEKCYTGETIAAERFAPGWIFPEDAPFVKASLEGLRSVGQDPQVSHYYFCTNGSYYAGKAGTPTVGFGGSLETLAHVDDEYIEVDHLVKACEGYFGIIRSFLGSKR
ncbi:MAG: YgeY family selenium metabolism-linked hydrolase [Thermovirgaceae bacterium]|nr:YgeY family selenium metabolism-linked hydrolase [Thermovirgaceae bacterium]